MHRTTILLPDELRRRAINLARQRGISLAELIRGALEEKVAAGPASFSDDPFFADHATFEGPGDLADNHDYYLYDLEDPHGSR
jgi:predicted DNA-binding protein